MLFGALVLLGLLALAFRPAPAEAEAARTALVTAQQALDRGDVPAAREAVGRARVHVDALQEAVQGIGGDVWSLVPVAGGAVRDVRHLGNALDDVTVVTEETVEVWPTVNGPDATLFAGRGVDVATLEGLLGALDTAGERLDSAQLELSQVADERPWLGDRLGRARDEALGQVSPLASRARHAAPLVDALPEVLGVEGERTYLLALLNPSEQRMSGGAPLTIAPLTMTDGQMEIGEARDTTDTELYRPLKWRKVKGDRFLRGRQRISTSTVAPDWPVAGEELLRAWEKLTGEPVEGLVVADVVALARMLEFTGPAEVPLYGRLDSGNFVEKLVGDYDSFPDNEARHSLNLSLVPLFADRLLTAGQAREKIAALEEAAAGRHFAVWLRDPDAQQAIADSGLDGSLSDTDHDYIAVLHQNTNASKSDYWQRRSVSSDVTLRPDGSAEVRLTITVHNDSPPYTQSFADPRGGTYVTRWNGMTIGLFLPRGVAAATADVAGRPVTPSVLSYYDRPYARLRLTIPPEQTRTVVVEYVVPQAATAEPDGVLAYRLDLTPQGMVVPQAVDVTVRWPEGYRLQDLPPQWEGQDPRTASYRDPGLETQPSFVVRAKG